MKQQDNTWCMSILEGVNDGILVADVHTKMIKFSNQAICSMLGYSSEELGRMSIQKIHPESDWSHVLSEFEAQARGEKKLVVDIPCLHKDGVVIYADINTEKIMLDGLECNVGIFHDITARRKMDEERKVHVRFLESLQRVDQAIKQETDVEQMLRHVLEVVFSIFDCDRAWLFYPCDPEAPSFRVPMEIYRPEYPGAKVLNVDLPMPPDMAQNLREALESTDPVTYTVGTEKPINKVSAGQFGVKSMMMVALYPKLGKPWAFGLHQCSTPRLWTKEEIKLFKEISNRISDGLSSVLFLRKLQESEERFHTMIDFTYDWEYWVGPDKQLLYMSPACERISGYRAEDFKRDSQLLTTIVHPDDRASFEQHGDAVLESAATMLDLRIITRSGEVRWISHACQSVYSADGRWLGRRVSNRDITERKQAEELVQKNETRFRQIACSVVDWIWEVDVLGRYTFASPAVTRILGYTPEEIIGKKCFYDFFEPEEKEALKKMAFDVFARKERISNLVNSNVCKDGHVVVLMTNAVPILDEEGYLLGYRGADTDITASRQAEKALKDSEQMLKSVMYGIPFSQFVINRDHRVVFWNKALEIGSGISAADVLGTKQHWKAFYDSERPCMADLLLNGASHDEIEIWYRDKECRASFVDGVYEAVDFFPRQGREGAWLRIAAALIRDSTGCVIGAVETLEDITERKKAEKVIQELNIDLERRIVERTAQLVAANRELESFSYSVSHDLRAPLRGIDGWSLALMEDYKDKLDAEALEHLRYIRSETQRMGQLIDDLLRLSRITRAEMNVMPVDITTIAGDIAARLRQANPVRQIEFIIQPGMQDKGDGHLLEIALTNLLDNAVKFTGKRDLARIEFGQTMINDRSTYFICDNGAGFNMAYVPKLFGTFQRMHSAAEFPGTGIGLASVKHIINRHGGRIWADAKVDQGATFYFTLQEAQ